ncbi:MAG: YCF48-related protein [Chlorobi bacterium]|nr:YCF48-related protein [Chlorobiota bacterium]MCI0716801.1 YCF48-related protein [Chlorobiota bacterium]
MSHQSSSSSKRAFIFFLFIFLVPSVLKSQWVQQVSGTDENLFAVYFFNNSTGFLGSNIYPNPPLIGGEIIRTSNGGDNWQRVLLDTNFRVKGFYFFDQNTGFAVGGSYTSTGYIYKTTNGGFNWINVTPPNLTTHLFNINFLNNSTGYAGGIYGVVKTMDGGVSWSRVLTVTINWLSWGKIFFNNVNTGFFTSDSGRVFKTTNGGAVWTVSSLTPSAFRDIKFTDSNTGYIVGDNGVIFKTTNQGASWNLLNSGVSQNLFSVFFSNLNTGYVTAEQTVLKTTNAGNSWFTVFNLGADSLLSTFFIDASTGYICGDQGRVYKTTTGGVIGIPPISTEVPKNFLLYQNFPNPFNPTTSIRFAIPKESFVKLAVYDMLGKKIQTLVSESLIPATYEVKWNAEGFSSGIYFYKIQAGDYTDVKKMSVIK